MSDKKSDNEKWCYRDAQSVCGNWCPLWCSNGDKFYEGICSFKAIAECLNSIEKQGR